MLLEKASAKIYGGYCNLESSSALFALRDLTGAPAKNFNLKEVVKEEKEEKKEEKTLRYLLLSSKNRGYPIVLSSYSGNAK